MQDKYNMKQNSIIHIPFNGQTIEAAGNGHNDYLVALKPLCDNVGVDYSGQLQRLKKQPWATVGMMPTVGADGKSRDMTAIDRQTLVMWLATIDTSRLQSDNAREIVTAYQRECAKVLDKHFFARRDDDEMAMARGLIAAKSMLDEARAQISAMAPEAELGRAMAGADGSMSVTKATRHVAAIYPWVTRDWVFATLRGRGMMCQADNSPTREGIDAGRLLAVTKTYTDCDGVERIGGQYAHVTPKGVEWLLSCAREGEVA